MTLIALLAVAPLAAAGDLPGRVEAGFDFWQTLSSGATAYPFANDPLPAGFFCPGSEPFKGRINFEGVPLETNPASILGTTDTIIERLDNAVFNARGVAKTRIRGRALSLVATEPFKNSCGTWKVTATLANDQPVTEMIFRREHQYGGNFDANLRLKIRVAFTNVDTGAVRSVIREVHLPTVHSVPFAFTKATATYSPATYTATACRSLIGTSTTSTQGITVLDGWVQTVDRPQAITEKRVAGGNVNLKAAVVTGCKCNADGQCMPIYSWHNPCGTTPPYPPPPQQGYDCELHFTQSPCYLGYTSQCPVYVEPVLVEQIKILRDLGYVNEDPEVVLRKQLRTREEIERDQSEKQK
jgi:hypothetical protein